MAKYQYTVQGADYEVEIVEIADNIANVTVNGVPFEVELKKALKPTTRPIQQVTAPVQKPVAAPAPAATTTPAEEQGLVIEEPSLNNVEVTSNEVNIAGAEEEGSIFGTPEMQAPASVETTAEDPAITEGPTLVIEDKEEAAPEMSAPVQTESAPEVEAEPAPEMAAPEVAPEVAPTTPEVVVSEPAPEMAPTVPEAPVATAPEVPAAPETPSAPTTPAQ